MLHRIRCTAWPPVTTYASTRTARPRRDPVPTTNAEHSLIPGSALFQVLIQLDEPLPSLRETRGHLKIEGERRSLLGDGATHGLAVLMRESGF